MATYPDLVPKDGDQPHITHKKILARLNAAAGTGVTTAIPLAVTGVHDHDRVIAPEVPAVETRPLGDFFLDMSRAKHEGAGQIHKFGFNAAVPNGSFADIWSYGPTVSPYPWPTTAEKVRVKSGGNGDDDIAGDGARTVRIFGLDQNWEFASDDIELAGAAQSAESTNTYRRIFRMYVVDTGTYGESNTGNIVLENVTSNQVLAYIDATLGQTNMTHFTIPAGFTGYLKAFQVQVSTGTTKDADIRLWIRPNAAKTNPPMRASRMVQQWIALVDNIQTDYNVARAIGEKTDIWVEAKGNGAVTAVNVTYDLFLFQESAPPEGGISRDNGTQLLTF
jgi:hypothetical protein